MATFYSPTTFTNWKSGRTGHMARSCGRTGSRATHARYSLAQAPPPPRRSRREGGARQVTWPRRGRRGLRRTLHVSLAASRPPTLPRGPDPKMAAPRERRDGGGSASLWAALLLTAVALRPAEAVFEPMTVAFDVRPGGVVHSFSQNAGPGVCAAAAPGD